MLVGIQQSSPYNQCSSNQTIFLHSEIDISHPEWRMSAAHSGPGESVQAPQQVCTGEYPISGQARRRVPSAAKPAAPDTHDQYRVHECSLIQCSAISAVSASSSDRSPSTRILLRECLYSGYNTSSRYPIISSALNNATEIRLGALWLQVKRTTGKEAWN